MENFERKKTMLEFILIEENAKTVEYKYFPEGHEDFGIVRYNIENKTFEKIKIDTEHGEVPNYTPYATKMISRIRQYAATGSYQKEGMIAWY